MGQPLKVGDKIPTFTLKDQQGREIKSADLIGKPFVLYFYPKDDTPGCTKEACSFRDHKDHLEALDARVIGISPDNVGSHAQFAGKYGLNFTLLSDEGMGLAKKFGITQEKEIEGKKIPSIIRSTYLIDENGSIRWMEKPVDVEGHSQRVMDAIHQNFP
jgi:thioredoxin-dependent peroxiredoxin